MGKPKYITPEPIAMVLTRLKEQKAWTVRELHRQTVETDRIYQLGPGRSGKGKGLTYSYLANLASGSDEQPSVETLRLLAKTFDVPPTTFMEFRAAVIRSLFDSDKTEWDEFVENVELFERIWKKDIPD